MTEILDRTPTISEIIYDLHQLGDTSVQIVTNTLLAIQERDLKSIRRFKAKSKDNQQSRQNNSQQHFNNNQFFLLENSSKKYYYNHVNIPLHGEILNWVRDGYNVNIIIQANKFRIINIIQKIQNWIHQDVVWNCLEYSQDKQIKDLICDQYYQNKATNYSKINYQFYPFQIQNITSKIPQNISQLTILNFYSLTSFSFLRIIAIPTQFFNLNSTNPTLSLVRKQISQFLNYIKLNPNRRYQQINKLITKRHWLTNILNQLLLGQNINYIYNYINHQISNQILFGKFQFFQKLFGIKNLVKKNYNQNQNIIINRQISKIYESNMESKRDNNKRKTNDNQLQIKNTINCNKSKQKTYNTNKNKSIPNSQSRKKDTKSSNCQTGKLPSPSADFDYCQGFQRKTHKYSIINDQAKDNDSQESLLIPQSLIITATNQIKQQPKITNNTNKQAITLLKAQHTREISQYHTTIQNLNKKLLILTQQKGLTQLLTIHQKQILFLQLKIKQLRQDIKSICGDKKQNQNQKIIQLKNTIKKLNEEITKIQEKLSMQKATQGKIKILERQVKDWQQKYDQSQLARKNLADQIKALTKRLAIQNQIMNRSQLKTCEFNLAYRDQQTMNQFNSLLTTFQFSDKSFNKQTKGYLQKKIMSLLADLSTNRDIILQCNSFLIELQGHIESKLGEKDPQIVLDCNRFIRGFLLGNLAVL